MKSIPLRVGLLWHSLSSGNLGVCALAEAHLALLARAAESQGLRCHFLVLGTGRGEPPSLRDELDARGHTIESRPARLLRPQFAKDIATCDLVLDIGEGDSFATIYGFRRFFYYWLSKQRVLRGGVPLVLAPQTIGPFDDGLARWLARDVMRRCNRVYARDDLSFRFLGEMGLGSVAAEATDVAFALPFERQRHAPGAMVHVGLNVSGLLYSGGYTGNNQFGLRCDYRAAMHSLVQSFLEMPDVQLHLVSHVLEPNRPVEDDLAAARELAAAFPRARLAPSFLRPADAKGYIAGLDFFAGARMHACIAALSAGVPVVPMAYSRKFNGLFGTLGYRPLADCKALDTGAVVAAVLQGYGHREAMRAEVAKALGSVAQKLGQYAEFLATQLRHASQRHDDAGARGT
jgi:polysaccharide pyruvyl transferase WcaK-like protein